MPLTSKQVIELDAAIISYNFPAVYFDFFLKKRMVVSSMAIVESYIVGLLKSSIITNVKFGLANVLYWGHESVGYRDIRVSNFINGVTDLQIEKFMDLLKNSNMPDLIKIQKIKMPEFSGISFISKILMFLNPVDYCVLDQQLCKLRPAMGKSLDKLVVETQIRVTKSNQSVYDAWRNECANISAIYFKSKYRVVDIERGLFSLIQSGKVTTAQGIYINA